MWRDHLTRLDVQQLAGRIDQVQQLGGFGVLIPGDRDWPAALNDLGDFAPYVLWTRGASSFLSRPLPDQVTITGARAATSYGGEHVAGELAGAVARDERVVVAGGAYGIEGAAHRAVLAAGGDTIAVLPAVLTGSTRPVTATSSNESLMSVSSSANCRRVLCRRDTGSWPGRGSWPHCRRNGDRGGRLAFGFAGGGASAQELGRAVGAVPGPVTSATSVGTHGLLREGGTASLVADSSDLAVLLEHNPDAGSSRSIAREPLDAAQIRDRQTDSSRTL